MACTNRMATVAGARCVGSCWRSWRMPSVTRSQARRRPRAPFPSAPASTIVTAITRPEGDYEPSRRWRSGRASGLSHLRAVRAWVPAELQMRRSVRRSDLGNARLLRARLQHQGLVDLPGRRTRHVDCGAPSSKPRARRSSTSSRPAAAAPADRALAPTSSSWGPALCGSARQRAGGRHDQRHPREAPAVQARGRTSAKRPGSSSSTMRPIRSRWSTTSERRRGATGGTDLRVVKIGYRCTPPAAPPGSERVARLERPSATASGRGLRPVFDFDSDAIRRGSESALGDIAEVMRRNPDWTLSIEGHTDDVASDRYNLELSSRRAASVKAGARVPASASPPVEAHHGGAPVNRGRRIGTTRSKAALATVAWSSSANDQRETTPRR